MLNAVQGGIKGAEIFVPGGPKFQKKYPGAPNQFYFDIFEPAGELKMGGPPFV